MHSRFSLFFILILFCFSCSSGKRNGDAKTVTLVPVDLADPHYSFLKNVDSTTPGKWKVSYYYLPDSTRYHDLYVGCSKDSVIATWCCKDLLLRNELPPTFKLETPDAIYFSFGDTANGPDLLVFSKKSNEKFREYRDVIKADYEKGVIVYLSDKCFQEGKPYELMLGDIPKMKRHRIPNKFPCTDADKSSPVDSVIFTTDEVSIMTTLIDQKKLYKQTRVIRR